MLTLLQTDQPINWLNFIQAGGVIGMFVLLSLAVLTRRIVPGWTYDAMEADRNYYRELAHRGTNIAARQMNVAEALTDRLLETEEGRRRDRLDTKAELLRRRGADDEELRRRRDQDDG